MTNHSLSKDCPEESLMIEDQWHFVQEKMETTIPKVYERIGWSNEEATLRFLWTDNHRIWNCEKFQQINVEDRFKVAKEKCLLPKSVRGAPW